VGLTGIPVFNVNNNCSTGSSALMLGRRRSRRVAECVLVVGFEKMEKGALGSKWTDRTNPLDKHVGVMNKAQGFNQAPPRRRCSAAPGREYRWRYGTKKETFGKIS
jgi:sterol carrier protein 2